VLLAALHVGLELYPPSWTSPEPEPYRVDRERLADLRPSYSADTLRCFLETAFRADNVTSSPRILRWTGNLRLSVHGEPTGRDRLTVERAISEIAPLIRPRRIGLVQQKANVDLYFLPGDELQAHEPNYRQGSPGLYWCWWYSTGAIYRARIVIATDAATDADRQRLIRTYLMRVLGFHGTTSSARDTVLAEEHDGTEVAGYSALDRALIELLYRPEIDLGLTRWIAQKYLADR
jgi:hypothetical protein